MGENIVRKILVVDDDKAVARALATKLKNSGYATTVAFNGHEALVELKKTKFDLILLDLVMPALDGFGVMEELKKNGNEIPIIVTSNLSQPEDVAKAETLGARDYFVKSNTSIFEIVRSIKND